jgi:hypothetical protein
MSVPSTVERFESLEGKVSAEEYNYEHFRTKHLLADAVATARSRGIRPGEVAPDFELPRVDGGMLRLTALRGRPVLLRFSSFT